MVDFIGKRQVFFPPESLSDAVKVFITIVGSLKIAVDGQGGAVISWHLQLKIRIMWDRHEFGECWPPQDGVILRFPVDNFELDALLPKVAWLTEDDH